jgi:integrase/recombinase XerC
LGGRETKAVRVQVESFYSNVSAIFDAWVTRRESPHTQRAYRDDVMTFVHFMGWRWPEDSMSMLGVSIRNVLDFRESLVQSGSAPKTINRRISSLSSFYKYLGGAAAELRLPITVPNPAHAQFIARSSSDPRKETRALTATRARQVMGLPSGDSLIDIRDRAILRTFLYTGIRLATGCRLKVSDFHQDGDEATIRLQEKGNKRRTIGIHFSAAEAIQEYLAAAEITSGALFRPRRHSRTDGLANRAMDEVTMWRTIEAYLCRLPGATHEVELPDGTTKRECVYSPHSLRATTATLLLDAGVDITKVQELLGHRHLTTTQIYDKRRRSHSESASHEVPI